MPGVLVSVSVRLAAGHVRGSRGGTWATTAWTDGHVEGTNQVDRINALTRAGVLVGWSRDTFHKLRRGRDDAAHDHLFDTTKALEALKLCWQLGDLFDRATGGTRAVTAFVPPVLPDETPEAGPREIAELRKALEGHRRVRARYEHRPSRGDEHAPPRHQQK